MKLCVSPPPKKREEKEAVHPCFQGHAGLCTNWLEVAFFPDPEPGPLGMGMGVGGEAGISLS